MKSQVLDATTLLPVPNARIQDIDHPNIDVKADHEGRFLLEPFIQWHLGYMWGVISFPIWPATFDVPPSERSIRIIAPGYDEAMYKVSASSVSDQEGRTGTDDQFIYVVGQFEVWRTKPATIARIPN